MVTAIVFGIIAMLVLTTGLILFVFLYQRRILAHHVELKRVNEQKELELMQASIQSEEAERARIASELHDDVAATLSSARLFLHNASNSFNKEAILQSKELLDDSISKIRVISHKLQPAVLQHLGLTMALQSLTEMLNHSGKIKTVFTVPGGIPRMRDNVELATYRICQELINNIIKHTSAQIIFLEIKEKDNMVNILFTHDGSGMTNENFEEQIYKKGTTGLKNIVNRSKSINATVHFFKDGDAYKTKVTIPMN